MLIPYGRKLYSLAPHVYMLNHTMQVDLSALPPDLAKVKVRAVLRRMVQRYGTAAAAATSTAATTAATTTDATTSDSSNEEPLAELQELMFVCGTGVQRSVHGVSTRKFDLRSYLREALRTNYRPPLIPFAPPMQQGCLVISKDQLEAWIAAQSAKQAAKQTVPL
jgi:hypothetical protein